MNRCMEEYIKNSIFREYDIRGVVETDFNDKLVYNIGKAFGTYLINNNCSNMSVSGDIRKTTPNLKKILIDGAISVGVNVYDMGILATPTNYFSLFNTDIKNSIQITGSHNPAEYNGFKISFNKKPFYGKSIQLLKNTIINEDYAKDCVGKLFTMNITNEYIDYISNAFDLKKKINVAMDCANASACLIAPVIYERLGIPSINIYSEIDNSFPNHHPDPTVDSNLEDLINKVLSSDSDLGIAFDGDADRLVVVDNKGRIIRSDILLALFVENIIKPNDSVVYDVKCSMSLKETIIKHGGLPIECPTGHSIIKNKIIDFNSKIGGEMSGHIFFSDKYFGYDDAVYVSLRLVEILAQTNLKLSDLVDRIPKYISTPEIRLDCENDYLKIEIVKIISEYFVASYNCSVIDGVKILFENGWALIRSSNTQPVIVLRFEANDLNNLEKYKKLVAIKLKELCSYDVQF